MNGAGDHRADDIPRGGAASAGLAEDGQTVSVAEAARLLGRDRTRVYACRRTPVLIFPSSSWPAGGTIVVLRHPVKDREWRKLLSRGELSR